MSEAIIGRIDELGSRIDDLEKSISDLMEEVGDVLRCVCGCSGEIRWKDVSSSSRFDRLAAYLYASPRLSHLLTF